MIFEIKHQPIGTRRTKISFCLIPRKFASDTCTKWLWLHRLKITQEYSWKDAPYKLEWITVEESFNN